MKRINRLLTIILLAVGFGFGQGASAIPIGLGSVPAATTTADFLGEGWFVGLDEPITAGPGAGVWRKILPFVIDEPIGPVPEAVGIVSGAQFFLAEFVTVGDGPA